MRSFSVMIAASCLLAGPAFAQASGAAPAAPGTVGGTATGGLPNRAANTTATGVTKPPGAAEGESLGTRPDIEERSNAVARRVENGICTGCK